MKRAIERNLVSPLSKLIASRQVRGGDVLRVDLDSELERLTFFNEGEKQPAAAAPRIDRLANLLALAASSGLEADPA